MKVNLKCAILFILFYSMTGYCQSYKSSNIAPLAKITASVNNGKGHFGAYHVADGIFPECLTWNDANGAWVIHQPEEWTNDPWLEFRWASPQTISEIHYYCRTAFFSFANFREYDLYIDDSETPLLTAEVDIAYGPQKLTLPKPVIASKIKMVLRGKGMFHQPGINEIEIYPEPIPDHLHNRAVKIPIGGMFVMPLDFQDKKHQTLINSPQSQQLKDDLFKGKLGFESVILIKRHNLFPSHVYTYHMEGFKPGGGLYIGQFKDEKLTYKKLIDSPDGEILDVDISYDAAELIFSWRKNKDDTFHVYRMDMDGSNLTQLTEGSSYNFNAIWLPDGGIAFLSTRQPAYAYCFISPVATLYRMERDGSNIIRLSANYLNDFTPTVLDDGRIIYSRWEYVDRPAIPIQSLWAINPDGTKLEGYYGNRVLSPATFMEPRQIPGTQKILCLLTAHNGPCRGGVGIIDVTYGDNSQQALTNLTPEVKMDSVDKGHGNDVAGYWENPYPLTNDLFVASYKGQIVLRDFDGDRMVLLTEETDPEAEGWFNPQPIRVRKKPPALASALPKGSDVKPWATVFLQDVYQGLEPYVKRGQIKQIAIVQELEKPKFADASKRTFGFQFPTVSCGATYAPKKVWGYAEVAEDGSASFKAPANVPIYFMALDKDGKALQRMRTFTHFMPGESQGCIGCHESRNTAPIPGALSMNTTVQQLQIPEWGLGGFDYARVVQPILDKHCINCHDSASPPQNLDLTGDKTDFFNVSYEHLAREGTMFENWRDGDFSRIWHNNRYTRWIRSSNGTEASIIYIKPLTWGSPVSLMADIIHQGHMDASGKKRLNMEDFEKRRIYAWIDLNVPYYPTSTSNHPELPGLRRVYPSQLDVVLNDVASRRCASCHGYDDQNKVKIPRKFWTRITNPQANSFLTAPLAPEAGGTGTCAQIVFQSKEDPDYRAILKTFEETTELIREHPRMDMPGGPELFQKTCEASETETCINN